MSQLALDGGEIISIFEGGGGKGEESCGDDWRVRSEQEYAGEKLDGWIECNLDIELTWRGLMRCGGELDVGHFALIDLLRCGRKSPDVLFALQYLLNDGNLQKC